MSRYTDIELTSQAPDGSWTWRAAGARQPRGTVSSDLVPTGGRVGDVVRAEIESGLEGVEVVSIAAPKQVRHIDEGVQRIEVLGAPRQAPGVSISLARGSRQREGERRPRREGRPGGDTRPRRDAEGPRRGRAGGPGAQRPVAREGERDAARQRPERGRRELRPSVAAVHRNAALATLRPEQLPVAEQLLRGGIPAVRQAIDEQNAAARAAGQPAVAADALMAMAEELLPLVNLASWKDRATAAQNAGKSIRLRELRAVVTASRTVSLDDEARTLAKSLQDALNERVTALRDEWQHRIESAIDSGRVLDALRVSARPPEMSTRCPAELAVRLAQGASEAMTAQVPADEWLALLQAVLESPVRRTVKPSGIPEDEAALDAARKAAGAVPELAKLIGLPIPPPPPRRPAPPRRALSPAVGGGSTAAP